jgi:ubiquinone/menaquinone biosynthesis C-methylase UbiE
MPEPATQGSGAVHPASTFDDQSLGYDVRAGLPSTVGALVARAIVEQARAEPGDLVVELGAGTGEIGAHLARRPVCYLGLDSSPAMLDVFRAKAVLASSSLVAADCNQPWPLPDGSAAVIFASRVIHLLDPEHVVREATRICRPGGALMLGRVLREHASIKERLRHRRQELLVEAGITPRQGEEGTRRVVALCVAAGGEFVSRRVVTEWNGETTAAAIIAGWDSLSRMGSMAVDPVTRARILDEIRAWAQIEIGDLDRSWPFRERYAIDIVRLP